MRTVSVTCEIFYIQKAYPRDDFLSFSQSLTYQTKEVPKSSVPISKVENQKHYPITPNEATLTINIHTKFAGLLLKVYSV